MKKRPFPFLSLPISTLTCVFPSSSDLVHFGENSRHINRTGKVTKTTKQFRTDKLELHTVSFIHSYSWLFESFTS